MTLGFVVVQLDVTVVNIATKTLESSLHSSISEVQWVVNAYTLAFASMILTAGALGDRLGARRVFITGFAIFTAGSLGCAVSPNITVLIIMRVIQGIGASILVPCSLALINHTFENPGERARAVGFWAAGASLAIAAGPVLGGALIKWFGWRSIFFINLPLGGLGIWLSIKYARETPTATNRDVDLKGQLAAVLGLVLLAASLIEGGRLGWTNRWVLGGLLLFALCFGGFLRFESKTAQPMMPLSMFHSRLFSMTALIGFLLNIAVYGLLFIISLYFQQLRGYTALQAGIAFLPMMGAIFVANILAPRLSERIGPIWVIAIGTAIFLAACLLMAGIGQATPYTHLWPQLAAYGFGAGLVVPPMTAAMLGAVDKSQSGIASGVLNSMRQTGSVVGVALFGSLIAQPDRFLGGLHLSMYISAAMLLVIIVAAMMALRKAPPQPHPSEAPSKQSQN